jgi:oligopeptide transport system ATP-binding protein
VKGTSPDVLPTEGGYGDQPLLAVDNLHVEFRTRAGIVRAVNGVSYSVNPGETLAVLGESGSGKSVTAQAIMGILDMPPAYIPMGEIRFRGTNLLKLSEEARTQVRGQRIAMIFQDALSALNPVFTVGWQVNDYPHQFSGGMRQRIMIAMSIALDPEVLIADEPTTALDVTVQAQIMELLAELQRESQMGLILITHDLGVVADVADKISVMYAGRIVENAPVHDIYRSPAHPYTKGLLESIPRVDLKGQDLYAIKGLPPNLLELPTGCAFHPRCPYRQDNCVTDSPPLYQISGTRGSACHYWREVLDGER